MPEWLPAKGWVQTSVLADILSGLSYVNVNLVNVHALKLISQSDKRV